MPQLVHSPESRGNKGGSRPSDTARKPQDEHWLARYVETRIWVTKLGADLFPVHTRPQASAVQYLVGLSGNLGRQALFTYGDMISHYLTSPSGVSVFALRGIYCTVKFGAGLLEFRAFRLSRACQNKKKSRL